MTQAQLTARLEDLAMDILALGEDHPEYLQATAEYDAITDMLSEGFYDS